MVGLCSGSAYCFGDIGDDMLLVKFCATLCLACSGASDAWQCGVGSLAQPTP